MAFLHTGALRALLSVFVYLIPLCFDCCVVRADPILKIGHLAPFNHPNEYYRIQYSQWQSAMQIAVEEINDSGRDRLGRLQENQPRPWLLLQMLTSHPNTIPHRDV